MAEDNSANAPIFKKRTKATFKRKLESSEDESETTPQLSVAEILRQRKQGKNRRGANEALIPQDEALPAPLASKQESDLDRMQNRFVPQTGQVVDMYDKQMNDYIEAKMAEYRSPNTTLSTPVAEQAATATETSVASSATTHRPDKQSVTAGKLMEVDLGDSLSRHQEETAAKAEKPVKVRLGRDGKPWRPRKRRNSENLARDALVDSILKENSLARFQDFTTSTAGNTGQSGYVDEDMVLQNFKSSYQDPERRDSRRATTTTNKQKQEQPKGPKLGGSKNARRAFEDKAAGKKT